MLRHAPLSPYLTLGAALCAVGCSRSTRPGGAGSGGAAPALSLVALYAKRTEAAASAAEPSEGHPPRPPRPPPPGASATALRSDFRARLTGLRVSAHVGSVIIRKRGDTWIT